MSWARSVSAEVQYLCMSSPNKQYVGMWYEIDPHPDCGDKYRVMIHRPSLDLFHVYVTKKYFRRFTLDTMPDELKAIMATVHSYDWSGLDPMFYVPPLSWSDEHPQYLKHIGWKTSQNEYCVIMDSSLLNKLRGESVS